MALQGSLSDFGIAEILQLIGSQTKTGILHVEGGPQEEEIQVYFSAGRIIRCDVSRRDKRDLLGTRLLAADLITKDQLAEALKKQKQSLKRVGDVLVEAGAIKQEDLLEFTDLQMRETLYRLFEWKQGKYRFESKPPNFARAVGNPISSESILMEGFQMLDEWPLIRAKINNFDLVFKPLRDLEDGESEAQALERILDDAFSEYVDAAPTAQPVKKGQTGATSNLGRGERRVLAMVDGKRSVYRLIELTRLGEFETCKSLVTLIDEGFIAPVRLKKAQEAPGRGHRGIDLVGLFTKAMVNLVVLGGVAAAALLMPWSRIELSNNSEQVATEARARVRANRLVSTGVALEVYRLEHGAYPEKLESLVEKGVLDPRVLDLPGATPLRYVSIGVDYDLR